MRFTAVVFILGETTTSITCRHNSKKLLSLTGCCNAVDYYATSGMECSLIKTKAWMRPYNNSE